MVGARRTPRIVAALAAACLLAWFTGPAAALPRAGDLVTADPVVGPEHPVSLPIEMPAGQSATSAVAFDGTNYLVVWQESRRSPSGSDIYGARVTPSGVVLDPFGIPIADNSPWDLDPTVAFGNGTFLVTWTSSPEASAGGPVSGARVAPSGAVLDPGGFRIADDSGSRPQIAFGDDRFLVVWSTVPGNDVLGAVVNPSGVVLYRTAIADGPGNAFSPVVAFGATAFLVVWSDDRSPATSLDVYGTRVDRSGYVLDPGGIPISAAPAFEVAPAVAFAGDVFLVVWTVPQGAPRNLFGARVSSSGTVLDPTGLAVNGPDNTAGWQPAVVASGTTFLVAWYGVEDGGPPDGLHGARIDVDGTNLDPSGLLLASPVLARTDRGPSLGSGRGGYLAVWTDGRYGSSHLVAAGVGADGTTRGPEAFVSRSANQQGASAVAFDGTNHLVVWSDARTPGGVYAARVSPSGRMLDPSDTLLATGYVGGDIEVVFDGENFLVAWAAGTVLTRRVSPSGSVLGPPVALPSNGLVVDVSIAVNDESALVTWGEATRTTRAVRGARVGRDGSVLDPAGISIDAAGAYNAVASDGRDFLVVWSDPTGLVRASRFGPDGALLGPAGFVVSSAPYGTRVALAWNGQRYLAVWDVRRPNGTSDVVAARITGDGGVQDPSGIAVATRPGDEDDPVVAADGGPFLIAWTERRTGRDGVHGARVDDTGAVLDPSGLDIAVSGSGDREAALVSGPDGTWGVAYTRFVTEAPYSANRVMFRTVAPK